MVGGPPLLAVLLALGAAPTARLSYEVRPGLQGCPDEQWVRSAVSARLGRDPFDDAAATKVRARIDRGPGAALEAQVEVERADGTTGRRKLDSPTGDCLELASAVELAITLAIEPLWLTKKPPPPEPPPAPLKKEEPPPPVTTPALAPSPPPPSTPVELRGRLGVLGTAGGVPGFTGGLVLGGVVAWPRFSLAVEGRVLLPTGVSFSGGYASTFSALGTVVPCLRAGWFSGCGVVTVGAFQVESTAADVRRQTTVMAQAGARVSGEVRLHRRVALVPWLEGAVILTRTSIVSGSSTLWVTWPVALSGGLFVEVNFSS
ncbi:MAG: hypothetical protein AB1938_29305 [Myxococcota bacterium]